MNRLAWLAIGALLMVGAHAGRAAPGLKVGRNDLQKLQGDWTIESWVQFGQPVNLSATWSFKGDKYMLDINGGVEEGKIKLDQGKKLATIDLNITAGGCKGNDQLGIYKIDGDTLTICLAYPSVANRPTDFSSTMDNRYMLVTLKRAKK